MTPAETTRLRALVADHLLRFDEPRSFGLGQFTCEYFIDLLGAVHISPVLDQAAGLAYQLLGPEILDGVGSVAGPKSGNVLLCNAVARNLGLPSVSVRDYPLVGRYLEGRLETGQRSVVVDDVASDGELLAEAIRHLRSAGARIRTAVVLVNRTEGDAREVLADLDVDLISGVELGDPDLARLAGA